ncbi:MAG TPA: hypothetical protein VK014_04260 [Cyclobacteriaceae bacterium]|nr:hypothetical protein [Cyclobacteriaceae bacterium]
MKTTFLHFLLFVSFLSFGCREEDNPYKEFEQERLAQLAAEKHEAIRQLAQPVECSDPSQWNVAEIETECGSSHIAYHNSTNKGKLLEMIKDYNLLMEIYRPYVAPFIFCLSYRPALGVKCEDGRAIVKYEETPN